MAKRADLIACAILGLVSLLYILYGARFAEINIQPEFLDFPIFIGEISLFFSVLFFLPHVFYSRRLTGRKYFDLFIIFYLVFLLFKTIYGYCVYGPLALRHAALFYYPLVALIVYLSLLKVKFLNEILKGLLPAIFLLFLFTQFSEYWVFGLIVLGLAGILIYQKKVARVILAGLLLVVLPYKMFFLTSRMMIVGNIAASFFLIACFYWILDWSKKIKVPFFGIIVSFIILGFFYTNIVSSAGSIFQKNEIIESFMEQDDDIQVHKEGFVRQEFMEVKIFNPSLKESKKIVIEDKRAAIEGKRAAIEDKKAAIEDKKAVTEDKKAGIEDKRVVKKGKWFTIYLDKLSGRDQGVAITNIVFRLLIWRDMIEEMAHFKPIIGFSFGRPLRSISLEICRWGEGEWGRDGWIEAHNSYLDVIYRAGILGVFFIFFLIYSLVRLIGIFIRFKDYTGILLTSIIVNWMVAANFLSIFELPYHAIPIWMVVGFTFAYGYNLVQRKKYEDSSGT